VRRCAPSGNSARSIKKENQRKQDKPEYKPPEQLIEERSEFSESVKAEAARIPTVLSPSSIAGELKRGRRDLRHLEIVTIDSEETKDVDDAISIERLPGGAYLLGVHIADVAHYVREGTALDAAAYERGTSVYLESRVLPMLPPGLSNGICSLNAGEDRLALSVLMTIDKEGEICRYEIFESLIRVKYKITYKQIYALFEGDTPSYRQEALREEYRQHLEDLQAMRELAELRHAVRYRRARSILIFPKRM